MKAIIKIQIEKIAGRPIDKILEKDPNLIKITVKTMHKLSESLEAYFKKQRIDTKITYEVLNG